MAVVHLHRRSDRLRALPPPIRWIGTALILCCMGHTTHQGRRRLLAHPATIALAAAGSSTVDLADELGVTRSAVGQYLSGARGAHPDLPAALRSLIGYDAAARVLALIPSPDESPVA
jgi:hypothetical protein